MFLAPAILCFGFLPVLPAAVPVARFDGLASLFLFREFEARGADFRVRAGCLPSVAPRPISTLSRRRVALGASLPPRAPRRA